MQTMKWKKSYGFDIICLEEISLFEVMCYLHCIASLSKSLLYKNNYFLHVERLQK